MLARPQRPSRYVLLTLALGVAAATACGSEDDPPCVPTGDTFRLCGMDGRVYDVDSCSEPTGGVQTCLGDTECFEDTPNQAACRAPNACVPTGVTVQVCDGSARVRTLDSCGDEVSGGVESCLGDTECFEDTPNQAACRLPTPSCIPTGDIVRVCEDGAERVRTLDTCGNEITGGVQTCLGDTVCDDSVANDAQCLLPTPDCIPDATTSTECDDDNERVVTVDSCGDPTGAVTTCLGNTACFEDTPGQAVCRNASGCVPDATTTRTCDPDGDERIVLVDSCGEESGIVQTCLGDTECFEDTPGSPECRPPAASCTPTGATFDVCDESNPDRVVTIDSCGDATGAVQTCLGDTYCIENTPGAAACDCAPSNPQITRCLAAGSSSIEEQSSYAPIDECGFFDSEATVDCAAGERCWYSFLPNGMVDESVGAICATSIDSRHAGTEYYSMGCGFDMFMHATTDLPIDCRCNRSNIDLPHCRPTPDAYDRLGLRLGTGPSTRGINLQRWGSGFIDATRGELFAPVHYTGGNATLKPGAIYAFDIETGDRRVVSGAYESDTGRVDVGSGHTVEGEALPYLWDIEHGSDDMIYAFGSNTLSNVQITRVDPDTGARTLIWQRQPVADAADTNYPYAQCWSGRASTTYASGFNPVQNAHRAFALGTDGSFYMGWNNDGVGVIRVSADGSQCDVVSRWASNNLPNVGGGVSPQYDTISGMLHHDGKLYVYTEQMLMTIDDATGDRAVFANVVGVSPGETHFFVDGTRDALFACGGVAPRKCSVHTLADGNVAQGLFRIGETQPVIPGAYPQIQGARGALDNNNYTGYGSVNLDPSDNNILYFIVNYGLVKYEISTGNSVIISI